MLTRAVIFTTMLGLASQAHGYAPNKIWEVSEDEYLGFEMIFLTGMPEPKLVYQVVFSTLDPRTQQCEVELRTMPEETADHYVGVVDFITDDTEDRSVIFPPNSEQPMSMIEFVLNYECIGFDDMRVPASY